jgi:AcrR family transcriptional regulator
VPGPRRLTDQGQERKAQLLDEATRLFAARGYADTRIIDICEAAGVAKGLFYWYFENKEALFSELVRSMRRQLRRAQAAAIDPTDDPVTRIRAAAEASVRFMADHAAFLSVIHAARSDETVSALRREGADEHVADTARLIAEAQAAGQVPPEHDPALLAQGVVATVTSFAQYHRSGRIALDVDALSEFVGQWVVQAIAGVIPAPVF